jgi:hypothetical protein
VAFRTPHMLLQWHGSFALDTSTPATDSFTGGLRFAGPGLAAVDTDERGDAVAAALAAWWKRSDNCIPQTARLSWVKWNRIGTDGKYVNNNSTRLIMYPQAVTSTNSAVYPQQVSLAASWGTDIQRGRGSRGRTFFPTNIPLDPSLGMRVSPAFCASVGDSIVKLIVGLNTAVNGGTAVTYPTGPFPVPGSSQGDAAYCMASVMSNIGTGTTGIINKVRIGNRLDIQRRRDNAVEEEYDVSIITTAQP